MSFDKLRMIEGLGFTPTLTLPLRGRGLLMMGRGLGGGLGWAVGEGICCVGGGDWGGVG